jgi:PleD family two-component response regulator
MRVFTTTENKKVLIASHREEEISLLESRLKARGYEVEAAETSVEVVHKVNRSHFALILLDAKMEEVRHTELAELLRRRSFLRSIPIVMMVDPDDLVSLLSSVDRGFDDFFVRPIDPLTLQLRVALNIRRAEERLETNPLTQLPGNVAIEKTILHLIETRATFSVVYADLDNFKALNDSLGYEKGDDVLRQTAYILEHNAKRFEGRFASFVGHLGGDDFVLVVCPTISEKLAKSIIKDFDKVVPTYYP